MIGDGSFATIETVLNELKRNARTGAGTSIRATIQVNDLMVEVDNSQVRMYDRMRNAFQIPVVNPIDTARVIGLSDVLRQALSRGPVPPAPAPAAAVAPGPARVPARALAPAQLLARIQAQAPVAAVAPGPAVAPAPAPVAAVAPGPARAPAPAPVAAVAPGPAVAPAPAPVAAVAPGPARAPAPAPVAAVAPAPAGAGAGGKGQAEEARLREKVGPYGNDAVQITTCKYEAEDDWTVSFERIRSGYTTAVILRRPETATSPPYIVRNYHTRESGYYHDEASALECLRVFLVPPYNGKAPSGKGKKRGASDDGFGALDVLAAVASRVRVAPPAPVAPAALAAPAAPAAPAPAPAAGEVVIDLTEAD